MYTAQGRRDSRHEREALIRRHAPLVRRIALHMIAKLPPSVELDDLIQVGMIGLFEALSRFESQQGVQFETFASQRIRGAMLDELREGDWMSRSARKNQKDMEAALHRAEQRLGRAPQESEIAAEMGLKLREYQRLLGRVRGMQLLSIEDMAGHAEEGQDSGDFLDRHIAPEAHDSSSADPLERLRDQRLRQALVQAIENLPEREQYIMGMYYEQDMNLKEIAAVLGVTESRVCQLHSQAVARLRIKMRGH